MTFREKLAKEHPEECDSIYIGGCYGCPHDYGYEEKKPCSPENVSEDTCSACWDREMPGTESGPSGTPAPTVRGTDEYQPDEYDRGYRNGYAAGLEAGKQAALELIRARLEEMEGNPK